MLRLDRYLIMNFMLGMLPVMLLLLSLFSFLELAETLKYVGQGSFVLFDALSVVVLTMPKRFVDLLPFTALLGGLFGLGAMANHHELIAIRAAGVKKRRIALPILWVALAMVALAATLQFLVIPQSERKAAQITSKSLRDTTVRVGENLELWTRNPDLIVRVKELRFNRQMTDIEIFQIDPAGQLTHVFQARRADIIGLDDWLLTDVRRSDLSALEVHEERIASLRWPGLLSGDQTATIMLPIQALTPANLLGYIRYLDGNKLSAHRYRVVFWQQMSIPLSMVAMALLSLPFLLGSVRHIPISQRMVLGGMIGLGFYLAEQITGNLAGLYEMNPALTILGPSLLVLGAAVYGISRH